MPTSISVLMPTFNRAKVLEKTLGGMTKLDLENLDVRFHIVDNNSNDTTQQVLTNYASKLPLDWSFEPTPGKNHALNRALNDARLGELVVFTDDDVNVDSQWLQAIADVSSRNLDYSVFGGRIEVVWPIQEIPGWANSEYVRSFGFAEHKYAETESEYVEPYYPFGPNFWVRAPTLTDRRFDIEVGPHPTNRILGDETLFLKKLASDGWRAFYSPHPVVGHRIDAEVVTVDGIYKRAYQLGRGTPHLNGLPRASELESNPAVWKARRVFSLARSKALVRITNMLPQTDARVLEGIGHRRDIGSGKEALHLARELTR